MPLATVAIVTRNRKETAVKAVESALSQEGDVEVILFDDASTDGTSELIRRRFPAVRVERAEEQAGYIVHRNRSVELADSPVVFSIDDDAVFDSPTVVRDVLEAFDDARIGAVAIRHDNVFRDGHVEPWWPPLPDAGKTWVVASFVGTAYAVRRDAFLRLGGFQTALYHWGEESDYCQRLYGHDLAVRLSPVGLVRHYPEGAGKYGRKVNRYISRNALLTTWLNAPARYVAPFTLGLLLRDAVKAVRAPRAAPALAEGTGMWLASLPKTLRMRRPIPLKGYRTWLQVRKQRLADFDAIADRLAPAPA